MAIIVNNVVPSFATGTQAGVSTITVNSSAINTVAGRFYILSTGCTNSTATANTPTSSGTGINFITLGSTTVGGQAVKVFGGYATATESGVVISFTTTVSNSGAVSMIVDELIGVRAANPAVQFKFSASTSVSMSALGKSTNPVYAVGFGSDTFGSVNAGSGYSLVSARNSGNLPTILSEAAVAGTTTPAFATAAGGSLVGMIAIEFNADFTSFTFTHKISGGQVGGFATSYNTASTTTVTGRLYFMAVTSAGASLVQSISTNLGVTWARLTTAQPYTELASDGVLELFYGFCTAGATGTWTVTTSNVGGSGSFGSMYTVTEIAGADPLAPAVQIGKTYSYSSPVTGTLEPFAKSTNAVYAVWQGFGNSNGPTSIVPELGWNLLATNTTGLASTNRQVTTYNYPDTTPSATWSGGSGTRVSVSGIFVELNFYVPPSYGAGPIAGSRMSMGFGI